MNRNILLIDDNQDLVEILTFILLRKGFRVSKAFTLNEGIRSLNSSNYELVISDLELPDGRGSELLALCENKQVPLILMSGSFVPADVVDTKKVVEMVYKPDLIGKLDHLLSAVFPNETLKT